MKEIIPAATLAQHVAVLGKTGSGKTSTAKLAIEQVVAQGARVCVLDPIKSDWWGLISSADGKKPGLPFHILGGPRGHVPLHASAGKAIAEIVASGALPLSIIDMADFEPGGQQRFFVDFAPALLRKMRGVVYLVVEEAHIFAPKERAGHEKENMAIHWAKTLATAGRSKGIRLILLTQRVQALHNALLGSCETLIAHRLSAPADQKPVLDWLKANASGGVQEMVSAQLSSLKTGAGWICSGEAKIFERFDFPRIHTYDNTATPTGDGEEHAVKTALVDADKLRSIIGEAVKDAEANDPKLLRGQIAALQSELAKKRISHVSADPDPMALDSAHSQGEKLGHERGLAEGYARGLRAMHPFMERLTTLHAAVTDHLDGYHGDLLKVTGSAPVVPQTHSKRSTTPRPAAAPRTDISGPQQRILDALAWLQAVGIENGHRTQLALLAKASPTSSSYGNNLSTLRTAGLIDYAEGSRVLLTAAGAAAANAPDVPPTTEDLHRQLRDELSGPQWRILEQLIKAYPAKVDKATLADLAGASVSSSSYGNNLSTLRSLGFIDYPSRGDVVALPVLFLERR